jgi:7-keto-8-aminopelargonate synthetase-like enzyme
MHEEWINQQLQDAEEKGLARKALALPETGGVIQIAGRSYLNFSSNDYLDLAHHPHLKARATQALEKYGAGSTSSRLVAGTLPIHEELEARIAQEKG